jgi:tetratricopeptide (TPR) repeat protein
MQKLKELMITHRNVVLGTVAIVIILVVVLVYKKNKGTDDMALSQNDTETVATATPEKVVAKRFPASAKKYTTEAVNYYQNQDYSKALTSVENALGSDITSAEAWQLKSLIQVKLGDLNQAFSSASRAVSNEPTNTMYWKWEISVVGMMKDKKGITATSVEFRTAIEPIYKEALVATKNNIEIVTSYAVFLEDVGDKKMAVEYLQKAIEINPPAKSSYELEIARLQK